MVQEPPKVVRLLITRSKEKRMTLYELFESPQQGMYNAEEDQRRYALNDTRKPKVTLKQLNKLKKYREFRKAQDEERNDVVSTVYAVPDEGAAPMPQ